MKLMLDLNGKEKENGGGGVVSLLCACMCVQCTCTIVWELYALVSLTMPRTIAQLVSVHDFSQG